MRRPLLIVRPEPGNSATAAKAAARGIEPIPLPLFEIEALDWVAEAPDHYVGLLFTSANGVRHAGRGLDRYLKLPAYAVGEATAKAAREAGFTSIVTGNRDVARLIAKVATLGTHRLLHLSGEDVTPFDAQGIAIDRRVVYQAATFPEPPEFQTAIARQPVILAHSSRAATRLDELVPFGGRSALPLVAISKAAASAAGAGWGKVAAAAVPRDDAMLDIAAKLCR